MLVRPIEREQSKIIHVISFRTDQGTIGATAEVISSGPMCMTKPGAMVLYGGSGLDCIDYPGLEKHKIIQEADVVGVLLDDELHPMNDILVCEAYTEARTDGIQIVSSDKPDRAKVKMVGPKVTEVFADEHIIFDTFAGQKIELERTSYLVMRECDVMAVLED